MVALSETSQTYCAFWDSVELGDVPVCKQWAGIVSSLFQDYL